MDAGINQLDFYFSALETLPSIASNHHSPRLKIIAADRQ
jgi:hypothetical protein